MSDQKTPDQFDRLLGALDGLPDVTRTKPVVRRIVPPLGVGGAQTFIVQTCRQKDEGDIVFLEHVSEAGTVRIVIPAEVSNVIARQRDQLTSKVRSKASKAAMQDRKDRGEVFGFQKKKTGGAA